ncbi:hypothetical protein AB0G15_03250 [Streptosporangium sp. NPDC023825]|uniref:hypothetical protein n=1 Tax=Streptosporangium sp. NPDC023825 TaxID=3154909 RepID=UPI00342B9867
MFAIAVVVTVLSFYGVSAVDMAFFGGYLALGLALPGLLLLRALYRRARRLARVEEVALGLALGYAVEVLVYVAARAAGSPSLVAAWPLATYVAFAAAPRLRRHWKGVARPCAPAWYSWSLALLVAYVAAWSSFTFFRTTPLTWPGIGTSLFDMPYHLALVGELRHHVPPTVPVVAGEPLLYHWFVYAHLAAASWTTGVEPLVLLFRLGMLPMLVAFVVLVGAIGHRVTGSRAGALLSIGGTIFVAVPSLYANANGLFTWTGVQHSAWESPTQTFGALLFAPVVLLLLDLLERRRRARGAGGWLLVGVFLVAVMGAKATYLPMLVAGLVAVAAVEVCVRRRSPRPALAALGMAAACLGYAQFVLFGGARQATIVDPLSLMRRTWGELTGLGENAAPSPASLAGITLLYALCWAVTWCGVAGLLRRPRLLTRPGVVLMLGVGAAGVGAVVLLGGPAMNQGYFLQGAYPYLAVAAACGFLVVARGERASVLATACAAGAGVAVAHLVRTLSGVEVPLPPGEPETALYRPYLALSALAVAVAVVLVATRRRFRGWALVIALVTAVGPLSAWHARALLIVRGGGEGGVYRVSRPAAPQVPPGALDAGRWLRAHSGPGDLVATNAHCAWGRREPCDSRHFWLSALSERRVLVEGWAYTASNLDRWRPGEPMTGLPFWDGERIRLNDEVFREPSAASVRLLRERYGVRWLLAEESGPGPAPEPGEPGESGRIGESGKAGEPGESGRIGEPGKPGKSGKSGESGRIGEPGKPGKLGETAKSGESGEPGEIGDFADLRFRAGDYAVYRIPDPSGASPDVFRESRP